MKLLVPKLLHKELQMAIPKQLILIIKDWLCSDGSNIREVSSTSGTREVHELAVSVHKVAIFSRVPETP